jgi:hypothetical protein
MPTWRPTLLLVLALGLALAGEVKVAAGARSVDVSVIRRVNVAYHPVTKQAPLEFDVEEPCWLRVYTRLWWPAGADGLLKYGLSLWQDDVERPVSFETGLSTSSFGPGGRKVGEWRSFFVQVPEGNGHFRLAVTSGAAETVGVRFALQAPQPGRPAVIPGARELVLADGRDTSRLRELKTGQATAIELTGPCRVRVHTRLSFDPGLVGAQNFVMAVREGRSLLVRRNLKAARSPSASYVNEPGLIPSSERTVKFSLPAGRHQLTLMLSGTLAKSGAVALEVVAGEKYE